MMDEDIICAIATAPGRASIGVLRISGPSLAALARTLIGFPPKPRQAHYCDFRDAGGAALDQGIALFFPAPNSFTGEDVLELQGHGGRIVLESLRGRALSLGARQARPGEFSERAFLNGKIDLLRAEAIADLIDADSRQAARSAVRTLTGEFSRLIHGLGAHLTGLRVMIESAIDFSDSDIEVLEPEQLRRGLEDAIGRLERIRERSRQGALLNEGVNIVLAGQPNAGKSSLMNALSGESAAIVTPIPGTTRDVLSRRIEIDGLPMQLTDTAGLRRTGDPIEREGVNRAREAMAGADLILLVVDASRLANPGKAISAAEINAALGSLAGEATADEAAEDLFGRTTIVLNKIDLLGWEPKQTDVRCNGTSLPLVQLSALRGAGLDLLAEHLKDSIAYEGGEDAFAARGRHLEAIGEAGKQCGMALANLRGGHPLELIAEDLRLAQAALGRITGEVTTDDLLGEIFSRFCIGK
ncbi:MAG: tRNA uridine-5-carboxymethylaminomethyl(34) synthesis GTPase MnmE [Gammaproteobacteria bacterium]|nr:tRNA uridine-5-carboxymethylaminomethyl(34) synthesis GTPase MnmE [Gammaproteobacteria bacterium]